MDVPTYLSVREAADYACVRESLVRGWIASGQLAHYRRGGADEHGKIVIAREDMDALLTAFKVERNSLVAFHDNRS